jgi:hypothetical protein
MNSTYRDECEAALARAESLARDNDLLRAENELLRRENAVLRTGHPALPPPPRPTRLVVLMVGGMAAGVMAAGAVTFIQLVRDGRARDEAPVTVAAPPAPPLLTLPQVEPQFVPAPPVAEPAAPVVRDVPTRDEVMAAMRAVTPAVRACAPRESKTVRVQLTFIRSGEVGLVHIEPPHQGTPVGRCIERAVRRARVPAFDRPSFVVGFPFRFRVDA